MLPEGFLPPTIWCIPAPRDGQETYTLIAQRFDALRSHALSLPEASEEFPWGHSAFKVRGKTFLFLNKEAAELSLSVKLPVSRDFALVFDFAEPTGYGLGRSGWVTARFASKDELDLDLLNRWVLESYRAVAPKKLSALLPPEPVE